MCLNKGFADVFLLYSFSVREERESETAVARKCGILFKAAVCGLPLSEKNIRQKMFFLTKGENAGKGRQKLSFEGFYGCFLWEMTFFMPIVQKKVAKSL